MIKLFKGNKIVTGIILLLIVVLFIVFLGKNVSNLPYNASDVFHLRSDCTSLGQKILDKTDIGNGPAQLQISHYNPTTNRCYVVLKSTLVDSYGTDFRENLYDGQTEELLAYVIDQTGKGAVHIGMIGNEPAKTSSSSSKSAFDITEEYINKIMADDRSR